MKRYFVDTNVIVRFLLHDVQTQYDATMALFEQAKSSNADIFLVPEVLFEIDYVLTKVYHVKKTIIVNNLKEIITTPYIHVLEREQLIEALSLYERLSIKFVDAYLFSIAKKEQAEVFSFDQDFRKLKAAG